MAKQHTTVAGTKLKRGERMTPGTGWKLVHKGAAERAFNATLKGTVNVGEARLAIFQVPKKQ
jgi:hypothetical protein